MNRPGTAHTERKEVCMYVQLTEKPEELKKNYKKGHALYKNSEI
jgi:hypothetical protein